ncbi:MAG: hydroxymethylbilane synthase [Alphaproteobacteria bacterium]|nr:hydroxymethylbilane synthase [Alphaproteobacteria bacterium]
MIRIGTRKSPLALKQADIVRDALIAYAGCLADEIKIIPMSTTGDQITDRRLMLIGGKGLFTKEIEEALIRDEVDIAVHSMKDVATVMPEALIIPCCLPREDVRDVWISHKSHHPKEMMAGMKVGTSSLRRSAQILHMNPQIEIVTLRGNVQTRLQKIEEGEADATVLAMAGLKRLNLSHVAKHVFDIEEMLPAPAQGALGIQCRREDRRIQQILSCLNHSQTWRAVEIERAFLAELDGSCRTPIAAWAEFENDMCTFKGLLSDPYGKTVIKEQIVAHEKEILSLVQQLGKEWLQQYGHAFYAAEEIE